MNKTLFGRNQWNKDELIQAYTFRFTETPDFTQEEDCIASAVNPAHKEGYDNISLLTKETYSRNVKATIECAFEGKGCPEIILVEKPEQCQDGVIRYGACFEVVLHIGGVNIWRHYRENGQCSWHKRLGVGYPVSENEKHTLEVEIKENYLTCAIDGQKNSLRVDDLFEKFHFGITVCEGIARVYSMAVEEL